MVKRKSKFKQPTARKSTRNRLVLNKIIMSQINDDENQLNNYQAEMTDDESDTPIRRESSQDTESSQIQESTITRPSIKQSTNKSIEVATTSTENRSNRSLRSRTITKSKIVTIQEPDISSQEDRTQNTSNASQHSDFIISIESQDYFTPPTSENLISSSQPETTLRQNRKSPNKNQQQQSKTLTQISNISDGDIEIDVRNIELNDEPETGWISEGSVHAFKYKFLNGQTTKNKIASFDLDGTLITPKSKNKFSRDINDWKLLSAALKPKISKLIDDGFNFVIFSNQMGVSYNFITLKQIKQKFMNIVKFIDLPCVALFCTSLDKNRKPATGMFDFYKKINKTQLELSKSFFVGDAMGRPKDHSAADLLFSFNCRIPFISIESFISGLERPKLFNLNDLKKYRVPNYPTDSIVDSRIFLKDNLGIENEFLYNEDLVKSINEFIDTNHKSVVILCIGLNGSGKSFFVKNHLLKDNFQCIDYDPFRKWNDEKKLFKDIVDNDDILDKRIVIDQPNLDFETRKKWINLAKTENYEIIAIYFNLKIDHCLHNVRFRNYYFNTEQKTPTKNALLKQCLKLKLPEYFEGFKSIYYIGFIANFNNDVYLKLKYSQFLYDKA